MSKAFLALAILKLRDVGRLSLDEPAETYLPELARWQYPSSDSPKIRIRDLLNNTAGFVTDDPWGDRATPMPQHEFATLIDAGVRFTRAPQVAYEYSNLGYALLGQIVMRVSGLPYDWYIEREILRPLGMLSTNYDIRRTPLAKRALGYRSIGESLAREADLLPGAFGAMGGIQTCASDYALWIAFLLSGWPPRDGPESSVACRATIRELAQGSNFPRLGTRPGTLGSQCPQAETYGMGLNVVIDRELGFALAHGGGYPGYGSYMLLMPDCGIGIYSFANLTYAIPNAAVWDAAVELHRSGIAMPRQDPASPDLAAAYSIVCDAYRLGNFGQTSGITMARNFFMDRSADEWSSELARLRDCFGECNSPSKIVATGRLSGQFEWQCERGTLRGQIHLAPTYPASIQAVEIHEDGLV